MKKFLFISTIVALFLGVLCITSCHQKEIFSSGTHDYITCDFSVGEQVNVNHYEIEVSVDAGHSFTDVAGVVLASEKLEDTYHIKADVTRFYKLTSVLYTRIKSVDSDGKVLYSSISHTSRKDL